MAELLLEILCEEIPARMQARAAEDLRLMLSEALASAGLAQGEARSFATPRRLALVIEGLAERSVDVEEERKGPRVGAPEAAIQGFLKGAGLASLAEAEVVKDAKKGDFYVARLRKPGRPAGAILGETVPDVLARFPWPKSMRWADSRLRWVRPLHGLLCQLDGAVVPVEIEGIASGGATRGHRFLSSGAVEVRGFADYAARLKAAKVVLSAEERAELIGREARRIADEHGLELVEDEGLLRENAGLVEWPGVLLGRFEDSFLSVPEEVLMTSMRTHQKCFSLRDPKDGRLVNAFLMVTNMKAKDGGATIVAGNEKVIRARLSDAKFFWEQDLKRPLDEMWSALHAITFHEKLGSQFERVERIAGLAEAIAPLVEADKADVRRAAQLCKADLVSGVVGEFPELQGLMGRYYAEAAGTKHAIADAIEEHYQPKGAGDEVPVKPVSVAVALADKLDTLVGFWAIDEKPTGSKDPFALRRAALGVVRTVLDNELRLPLARLIEGAEQALRGQLGSAEGASKAADLLGFLADRLKVRLREEGARHDLIDAVLAAGAPDDLLMIVRRVEALGAFLATEDGASLLAGVKRAANILRIEEKKDKRAYDGAVEPARLEAPEEKVLGEAISQAVGAAGAAIAKEDFAGAMAAIAALRAPVDAFFEKVTVNVEDKGLRENRLNLLARIRSATQQVADLSKVQ